MKYVDEKSGISFPLDHPFALQLAKNIQKGMDEEKSWIQQLRAQGVKMAHPADGWVNRERNELCPVYPQFNDGLNTGDLLALGWPRDFRLVIVTGHRRSMFGSDYFSFETLQK